MKKTLDEVIKALEMCTADNCICLSGCPYSYLADGDDGCEYHAIPAMQTDALYYLKEYRSEKAMWEADKKAYEDERQKAIHATKKARERYIALAKDTKDELAVLRDFWAEQQDNPPLTWDELFSLEMIGRPVWSEEKRAWYLIQDSALDNRSWVDLIDAYGGRFRIVEHGLREYALYRKETK